MPRELDCPDPGRDSFCLSVSLSGCVQNNLVSLFDNGPAYSHVNCFEEVFTFSENALTFEPVCVNRVIVISIPPGRQKMKLNFKIPECLKFQILLQNGTEITL